MLDARPGEAIVRLAPVPERDHAVDALRVLAILGVVLGHWLVTALVAGPSGRDLHVTSPLKAMPYLAPISWVFQTLAVFFLVGGYAAAKSRRPGEAWGTLMRRRLTRFARPLPVLALAWIPAAAALRWAGFSSGTVRTMVELVLSPLWFLCVYAVLTACGPLVASAWDRFGWRGAALLVAATAAIDLGRFALDTPGWTGWATILTAWLLPFYLGTGWARGALRSRRSGFALLVGGTAATALLVLFAGYPASMVGVPGAAVSNLSPPTLAAVAFGLAQTGLAVLLHGPLTRWTRHARVRALLDASGVSAMTVYLWHQTALMAVTVVTLLTLGNLQGVHTAPGGPEWIMMRLPWLAAFAAVLVVLRTVTGRFETGRFETRVRDRPVRDRPGRTRAAPPHRPWMVDIRTMPPNATTPGTTHVRRPRARRLRTALAGAASTAVLMLTTAGTGHADPYAAPVPVPQLAPSTLDVRYAAERGAIEEALKTAQDVGDTDRRKALGAFLQPGRRFLYFDPRGGGRAVEVVGDIARARRVAVLVPGADTTLSAFDTRGGKPWSTPGGGARAVYAQARSMSPDPELAVVAWLGYAAPKTFSSDVLTDGRAAEGAGKLRHFMKGLHRVNPSATVGLLCHSYGSVVCGRAALDAPKSPSWRQVTDIALYGSPGTSAWSAATLSRSARVWAGRGTSDWMEEVPHVRFLGIGLGPDPVSPEFGARVFDAGSGGHSDYLAPGSAPLRNLTGIALGRASAVTRG